MNPVLHVEIPVRDLGRAMRYYESILGVTFGDIVTIHGNRMAYFPFANGQDGASAALAQGNIYVPSHDGAVIYFAVPDIDDVLDRAVAQGSEILFPKWPTGDGVFVAEVSDSEGNRIALQSAGPEAVQRELGS